MASAAWRVTCGPAAFGFDSRKSRAWIGNEARASRFDSGH